MSARGARPRIAVAHEWLTNWAGSEQVVEQMVGLTRAPEVVASIVSPELAAERLPGTRVRGLWPSNLPGAAEHWTRYAPAMMAAWATARIDADALVVSSHFAAHALAARFDGPSIVYYHTPARMLWRPEIELDRLPPASREAVRRFVLPGLRRYDARAAAGATKVIANSVAVAQRIRAAYGRDATVVPPPVDVQRWQSVPREGRTHLLWLGRLVAYKRPDLAVEIARRTGLPMVMIGDGPLRESLARTAPPNVHLLGHAPEETVREAMAGAIAMVFPGEEDFGIASVECLAAGVPVVAYATGGALDYVVHGRNGLLVSDQEADALTAAVNEAASTSWDTDAVRASASRYSREEFRRRFAAELDSLLGPAWRPASTTGVS